VLFTVKGNKVIGEMMAFKPDGEFKGVKDKFVFDLPKKE